MNADRVGMKENIVFALKVIAGIFGFFVLAIGTMPCLSFVWTVKLLFSDRPFHLIFLASFGVFYLLVWWGLPILVALRRTGNIYFTAVYVALWAGQVFVLSQLPFKATPDTFARAFGAKEIEGER